MAAIEHIRMALELGVGAGVVITGAEVAGAPVSSTGA
jgi:hypothetical protein